VKDRRIEKELRKNIYLRKELDKLKREQTQETWLLKNDIRMLVFYRMTPRGMPKVVSLGEEMPRSGTRRCKEHKT
jgi:hypothetical protein